MIERPRAGMWVRAKNHTGIITTPGATVSTVDIVDEDGVTVESNVRVANDSMTQAKAAHIPEKRRPAAQVLRHFGYE